MKTAISVEAELLRSADESAREMGITRSRLFVLALQDFLERRRQAQMLQRLNEAYSDGDPAEKTLLGKMKALTSRTIKGQMVTDFRQADRL